MTESWIQIGADLTSLSRRDPYQGTMPSRPVHPSKAARVATPRGRDSGPDGPREFSTRAVYAIFACWTLFAVFVYSHFSQLGDANSYLSGAYDDTGQARTYFITLLATRLMALVHSDLVAHLVYSMFAASGVAYMVRQARVHGPYRWALLAILLCPNFGVWASVIGREALFIGLLGFFMGAVIGYFTERGIGRLLLALACVAGMIFIRSPYGIGTALFLLMFLIYLWGPRTQLSVGVQFLGFAAVAGFVLFLAWPMIDDYIAGDVLPKAKTFFTINSDTTRLWMNLTTTPQLFRGLWWMLPMALVGPTPAEVAARPLMLPFFLSGMMVLCVLLFSLYVAWRKSPPGLLRKILVLGWMPSLALILVSYVPFGVYNPGSGIRYESCFLLFLILPSMFISAVTAEEPEAPLVDVIPRGEEWRVLVH
jgi:hypothetical protein